MQQSAATVSRARQAVSERSETAAGAVAAACTEWTGRETSAEEVKKAAVTAGSIAVGMGVAMTMGGAAARLMQQTQGGLRGGAAAGRHSGGEWGNDVMDHAHKFFADNGGSLNIETQYIDQDGCVLY